MTTLSNEMLVTVAGGRSQTVEQDRQAQNYAGCLAWARATGEGRDYKISRCTDEYVRRNWDKFGPQPQPF